VLGVDGQTAPPATPLVGLRLTVRAYCMTGGIDRTYGLEMSLQHLNQLPIHSHTEVTTYAMSPTVGGCNGDLAEGDQDPARSQATGAGITRTHSARVSSSLARGLQTATCTQSCRRV